MENKIVSYRSSAMNRVDQFYQFSQNGSFISCILTIEHVKVVDEVDDIVMLSVDASALNHDAAFTFDTLVGKEDASKYKIGDAWNMAGTYSMDWDNKRIELHLQVEEQLSSKFCWASKYARDNRLAVRKYIKNKYTTEWLPIENTT